MAFGFSTTLNPPSPLALTTNDVTPPVCISICIGYHLPDITIKQANFTKPVYFSECEFQGLTDFSSATFSTQADFSSANFQELTEFNKAAFFDRTYFSDRQGLGTFNGETRFNYTLFEDEKIIFEVQDLSNVSFMNSDITCIIMH